MLAHNVYFTLHDATEAAQQTMIEACQKYLSGHPGTTHFFVGRRKLDYRRDVNDLEFDICLNIVFVDESSHDAYQGAPRHLQFIEENRDNWKQVRVFDSQG